MSNQRKRVGGGIFAPKSKIDDSNGSIRNNNHNNNGSIHSGNFTRKAASINDIEGQAEQIDINTRRKGKSMRNPYNYSNKLARKRRARWTFFLVLFWPLGYFLYYLYSSQSTEVIYKPEGRSLSDGLGQNNNDAVTFAYVVYGQDERILKTVESILDTAVGNAIILPMLDGVTNRSLAAELEGKLKALQSRNDLYSDILLFHVTTYLEDDSIGVTRSRILGAEFAMATAQKYHLSSDKIVLMFVRGDSELLSRWTDPVLEALHLGGGGSTASALRPKYAMEDPLNLSNIVSFSAVFSSEVSQVGSAVSFSYALDPTWKKTVNSNGKANLSSGLAGAVSAMRLSTYQNLVVQDKLLSSSISADMNLAFNVWMCGDGIDVLPDALAKVNLIDSDDYNDKLHLSDFEAARIAGTWMPNGPFSEIVFQGRGGDNVEIQQSMKKVMQDVMNNLKYHDLTSKCHSFDWFVKNVNKEWKSVADLALEKTKEVVKPAPRTTIKRYTDALDVDGNPGYVYDETWLRDTNPISENMNCGSDTNYRMLTEKVKLASPSSDAPKVMCVVYTIEKYHHKIPAITNTWGPNCDGFLVASDKTVIEPEIHTVNILHEGPEEYNNIWQKIRSIWRYVYENYYDKYDYFHVGGDDLFVIVENLKYYLESDEISSITDTQELFMGRRFAEQGHIDRIFNSGGSGYTMNKRAMKMLATNLYEREDRKCGPHAHTFAEDVMTAACFRANNVLPYDTRDEFGSERYMPFKPGHHLTYQAPKDVTKDWYAEYMQFFDMKYGLDHCSKYSIAFHYVEPKEMKRFYSIMHGLCK